MLRWRSSLLTVILIGRAMSDSSCDPASKPKSVTLRLKHSLLCNYNKNMRPVRLQSDPTDVTVEMIPLYFNYEKYFDAFALQAAVNFIWRDEYLQWNASDYGGVKYIRMDSNSIWVPEIYHISKQPSDPLNIGNSDGSCTLTSSGLVDCRTKRDFEAMCRIDLTYWPYDHQNCTVILSTTTKSEQEIHLDLLPQSFNLREYLPNREWRILNIGYRTTERMFLDKVHPCLEFNFQMQRDDSITQTTVIAPVIIFVVLTLTTLLMDGKEGVRFNLCCTLIVCHSLIIEDVGHIQNGDKAPVVGKMFRDSMVLCVLCLELAILAQWVDETSPSTKVPDFITRITKSTSAQLLLFPTKILCLKKNKTTEEDDTNQADLTLGETTGGWHIFGVLIDRVAFLVFTNVYVGLFLSYIF